MTIRIRHGDVAELAGAASLVLFVAKMAWKEKGVGDPVDSMFRILLYYTLALWFLTDSNALPIDQKKVYIIAIK